MERGAAMYESQTGGQANHGPRASDPRRQFRRWEWDWTTQHTFAMTRTFVDDFVLVSEAEIAAAIRHAYWQERQVIEGSGSVGIAALLSGKIKDPGQVHHTDIRTEYRHDLHHRIISGEDVDVALES